MSRRTAIVLLAACAACATGRGAFGARQIDQPLPAAASLPEGPDRDALQAAQAQEAHGDAAGVAHDTARAEWAGAGTAYAELAGRSGFAEWRVPLRLRASELLLRAQRWDPAATTAGALVSDAQSSDASRAVGARIVATAWIGAANASAKAGQLEKLDLGPEKKDGPRPPPPAWRRVVESADAYLARAGADPDGRTGPADRPLSGPQIALAAAEVQFAYGELDDVRRRLDAALDRWPSDAKLLEEAVPLYLATYLARGDRDGHLAAIERLRARAEAEGAKAPADRKAAFAKIAETLARERSVGRFAHGEDLLKQQKPAEAAQAFEAAASAISGPDRRRSPGARRPSGSAAARAR